MRYLRQTTKGPALVTTGVYLLVALVGVVWGVFLAVEVARLVWGLAQ